MVRLYVLTNERSRRRSELTYGGAQLAQLPPRDAVGRPHQFVHLRPDTRRRLAGAAVCASSAIIRQKPTPANFPARTGDGVHLCFMALSFRAWAGRRGGVRKMPADLSAVTSPRLALYVGRSARRYNVEEGGRASRVEITVLGDTPTKAERPSVRSEVRVGRALGVALRPNAYESHPSAAAGTNASGHTRRHSGSGNMLSLSPRCV